MSWSSRENRSLVFAANRASMTSLWARRRSAVRCNTLSETWEKSAQSSSSKALVSRNHLAVSRSEPGWTIRPHTSAAAYICSLSVKPQLSRISKNPSCLIWVRAMCSVPIVRHREVVVELTSTVSKRGASTGASLGPVFVPSCSSKACAPSVCSCNLF